MAESFVRADLVDARVHLCGDLLGHAHRSQILYSTDEAGLARSIRGFGDPYLAVPAHGTRGLDPVDGTPGAVSGAPAKGRWPEAAEALATAGSAGIKASRQGDAALAVTGVDLSAVEDTLGAGSYGLEAVVAAARQWRGDPAGDTAARALRSGVRAIADVGGSALLYTLATGVECGPAVVLCAGVGVVATVVGGDLADQAVNEMPDMRPSLHEQEENVERKLRHEIAADSTTVDDGTRQAVDDLAGQIARHDLAHQPDVVAELDTVLFDAAQADGLSRPIGTTTQPLATGPNAEPPPVTDTARPCRARAGHVARPTG